MSNIIFTKPVSVDSFPAFFVEFFVQYLNQKNTYKGMNDFLNDIVYSFYSQEELNKLKQSTFNAITINNSTSPPLLIISCFNFNNLTFQDFFEKAKEAYKEIGQELSPAIKYHKFNNYYNDHVFFVATIESCSGSGTMLAYKGQNDNFSIFSR